MTENIENIKNITYNICKKYPVKSLFLIGSAAKGSLNPESDIDLLYSFKEEDIQDNLYAEYFFSFQQDLQDAFQRKVDLVANDFLKNPYFIKSVNQDKVLIYEG